MAVDFSRYQPPGVYVQDTSDPIVTGGGLPPSLVCIVGPARGYQTATETVIISDTEGAVLKNRGVQVTEVVGPPTIEAPVVTTLAGDELTVDTDYTFSSEAGDVPGAEVVSISRVVTSPNLSNGDAVIVTYNFVDHLYHSPRVVDSFSRAISVYGLPLVQQTPESPDATQVESPLSLGIQLAFQNGASEVLAIPLDPSDGDLRAQFEAAYAKVVNDYRANIVIPVFQDDLTVNEGTVSGLVQTIAQDLRAHCNTASSDGYMRVGMLGLPANYDDTDLPVDTLALNVASKRVAICYPHRMQIFNSSINASTGVAGCFLAAALGGRLASLPVNTGLTHQVVSGFTGIESAIKQEMGRTAKNQLSSNGVLVLESDRIGRLLVRHGVTSDMTSLTNRELSMVRINDAVHVGVQVGVENSGLIGSPIDAEMVVRVQGVIQSALEQLRIGEAIVDWSNLTVRQQSLDPSVIEAEFAYRPAVPLNYIVVSYSVDLNTGEINNGEAFTQ